MPEPYYAAVSWSDHSWSEAMRDSHAEAEAWLREASAHDEPVATVLLPQRQREETPRTMPARLAALREPTTAHWAGPLYAARMLCASDHRDAPELVDRRLGELDVGAELVETALAVRIVTTARHYSLGPTEALHLELDDVRWNKQDSLEAAVPDAVAAEISELRCRAHADPTWWASLWKHMNTILHGQLLAGLGGNSRARSPSIIERLQTLEGCEHG